MKKLIVLLSMVLIGFAGYAVAPEGRSVMTKNGRVDCKRVSMNAVKARMVLSNGEIVKMPVELISSYNESGKQFDKVGLYKEGKNAKKTVFMQLMKKRGDYSLYRYKSIDYNASSAFERTDIFYVYQQGKYYMEVNEKSLPNVFMFFNLKYKYV